MAETANFRLDTNDVLGFDYSSYVDEMRALAISEPAKYFKLRKEILEKVRRDAVGDVYTTLFNVLSAGKDKAGAPIGATFGRGVYIPKYPSNKINDFAITVASDMADHINRAIDIILPDSFEKLAGDKLMIKGAGSRIGAQVVAPFEA